LYLGAADDTLWQTQSKSRQKGAGLPDNSNSELIRLRALVAELSALNEILAALSATMSVERITEVIIDKTIRHLNASQGAVFLLVDDQDDSTALTTFVRRKSDDGRDVSLHLNNNIVGYMEGHKGVLRINSIRDENPFGSLDLASLGIRSLLAARLLSRTGMIGVLAVFNKEGDTGFTDEDRSFLGILGTQCAQTIETARLYEEEQRLNTLRRELRFARTVQQSLLPRPGDTVDASFVCGFNEPAREVGGDYFDIVPLSDDEIFVSICDVSGKGVPAALLMSNALAIQRSHLIGTTELSLDLLTSLINRSLCQFIRPGEYITGVLGLYNQARRTFRYTCAGHSPPILIRPDGSILEPDGSDFILGFQPECGYCCREFDVEPDSLICLYTDGVTDAEAPSGEFFDHPRLLEVLQQNQAAPADRVCAAISEAIAAYRGATDQSDDITAVILKT